MGLEYPNQVPDVIKNMLGSLEQPKQRSVKKAFFLDGTYVAFADDDTAWILVRQAGQAAYWRQLDDAGAPALPQGVMF